MGTGKHRSKAQIARDRRRISDLYLQGWLQADIADTIGVSAPTVSRDLKALQADWLESALIDFNEAKARELAKVDRLEREYWQAWRRSCEDAETIRQEGSRRGEDGSKKLPPVDKVVKTSKGQAGDPRFLQGVQWCIDKRCKILGIDAPQKLEHTGKDGGPIQTKEVGLTDAERLAALAAMLEQLPEEAAGHADNEGDD